MIDWLPIWVSVKLAIATTAVLLLVAIPLSYAISKSRRVVSIFLESLLALPLVLPPTVIGFYLLLAFSPSSVLGSAMNGWFGIDLLFSFEGLVLGSVIYSLPFMVQPLLSGIRSLPSTMTESAYLMGLSPWKTFLTISLPNAKHAILGACVLTFAHTIGEFGVILMIGGSIEGVTEVASVAIYDRVEAMDYFTAHTYSIIMIILSLMILILARLLIRSKIEMQ